MNVKNFARSHKKELIEIGVAATISALAYAYIRGRSSVPLTGFADFGEVKIYDEDVYKAVKKSTKIIDRLNTRKVVETTLYRFAEMAPSKGIDSVTVEAIKESIN